jgi:hypothetical protein
LINFVASIVNNTIAIVKNLKKTKEDDNEEKKVTKKKKAE